MNEPSPRDLRAVRELMLAFGLVKPPKKSAGARKAKRKQQKTLAEIQHDYLAEQKHPPTGYPCTICGKVINQYHEGVQESRDEG